MHDECFTESTLQFLTSYKSKIPYGVYSGEWDNSSLTYLVPFLDGKTFTCYLKRFINYRSVPDVNMGIIHYLKSHVLLHIPISETFQVNFSTEHELHIWLVESCPIYVRILVIVVYNVFCYCWLNNIIVVTVW